MTNIGLNNNLKINIMKKEKITRATLDELEKTMPVLSENEQRNCTGGYRYYDESGMFIEKIGDEDEIRIITRNNFDNLKLDCGNYTANDKTLFKSHSTAFSDANNSIQLNILKFMANKIGYDGNITINGANNNGSCSGKSYITISNTSSIFKSSHYFDLLSVLIHEVEHSNTINESGSLMSEYTATKAQYDSPYFKSYSTERQKEIADRLAYYKKLLEKE
ncbi:MAG: hypothetical protein Q4G05_06845 [Clostridia bacterium]|nr:hypothetical protein [Clostridia bacterium]